jgi:hypothetical protein
MKERRWRQESLQNQQIEQMQRESVARRKAHPDWPSHKITARFPHLPGVHVVCETMPVGKAAVRGYCKYCYTTHWNWWAMDPRESDPDDALLLCGNCEHNSLQNWLLITPAGGA